MEKLTTPKSGFTIIELLVYVSIVTVAITVFAAFMADVTSSAARSKVVKEVQANAQFIMDRITNDVRHAQGIGAVSASSLRLTMSAGQSVTYAYDSTTNAATYQQNSGTAVALSTTAVRVTNLSFANSSGVITVTVTVAQGNPSATIANSHSTTLTSTAVVHSAVYN